MTRAMESNLPKDALRSIQAGTVAFTYRGVLCQKKPFDLALSQAPDLTRSRPANDLRSSGLLPTPSQTDRASCWALRA